LLPFCSRDRMKRIDEGPATAASAILAWVGQRYSTHYRCGGGGGNRSLRRLLLQVILRQSLTTQHCDS